MVADKDSQPQELTQSAETDTEEKSSDAQEQEVKTTGVEPASTGEETKGDSGITRIQWYWI